MYKGEYVNEGKHYIIFEKHYINHTLSSSILQLHFQLIAYCNRLLQPAKSKG